MTVTWTAPDGASQAVLFVFPYEGAVVDRSALALWDVDDVCPSP